MDDAASSSNETSTAIPLSATGEISGATTIESSPASPVVETATASLLADAEPSDQEMDIDDDGDIPALTDDLPDNFRDIANTTLENLRKRNIDIAKRLVVYTTLMAGTLTAQQLEKYRQQCRILDKEHHENQDAIIRMETALRMLNQNEQPSTAPTTVAVATPPTAAAATTEKTIKPTSDMPRYIANPVNDNDTNMVRVFLERFVTHLKTRLGSETFEQECHRYLIVLTINDNCQMELQRRYSQIEGPIGWDLAEKTFLEVCLTKEERLENMRAMADVGRETKETYQKYANRIDRNARVYGIQDNNDMVIHQLIRSIPSDTYDLLLFKHQLKEPEALTFKSISAFCNVLKTLHGPDDALGIVRQTMHSQQQQEQSNNSQSPSAQRNTTEDYAADTEKDTVAHREEDAVATE
ncbi:hypothetical protein BGW39_002034 [Mortierella sp. 14UC]|nr:hypothetical protein BGW39_002034 [Mortierella sp. 14UC]